MAAFGWTVLALVFLDELLAVTAFGVWGWSTTPRWLLVWLLPLLGILVWALFASPRAPYGGTVVRPLAKVLVFGLASLALWNAGHHLLATALAAFSVAVNALAMLPSVRALITDPPRTT